MSRHRRSLAVSSVLLGSALVAAACGSSGSSSSNASKSTAATSGSSGSAGSSSLSGKLSIYLSSDTNIDSLYTKQLIPAFEKAYPGVKVDLLWSSHGTEDTTTLARLTAAVQGGHDPGIGIYDAGLVTSAATDGLLQPLTTAEVPNLSHVMANELTPVDSAALPYRGSEVLLGYNSTEVKSPPTTVQGLLAWIKAHPGKFTYNTPSSGGSGQGFVEGVLNSYIPKADVDKMAAGYDPSLENQWNKGLAELHSIGKDMYGNGVYPNGNTASLDLLANGSAWMVPVWSDQSTSAIESGVLPSTTKLIAPSPPFLGGPAYLGVAKTAPAQVKKMAFAFENFLLTGDMQTAIYKAVAGFPAVQAQYVTGLPSSVTSLLGKYTLPYSQKMVSDMENAWQSKVPG